MKIVVTIIKIAAIACILLCTLLYFIQEKLIFFPQQLPADYKFTFDQQFQELQFNTPDGPKLHGLLFKADSSKGLIFYLHGNAGSLASWGQVAKSYTDAGYDLFMLDYRGYGKSGGSIHNEDQFYNDVQLVYDSIRKKYDEKNIVVLGYSIGTGAATKLASVNHPRLLILQAPYFSLTDMAKKNFSIIPSFILKYKFQTNIFLEKCKMPVVIFHGDQDEVIYYGSSIKLKALFKPSDTLITLRGQGHNGMSNTLAYISELKKVLNRP